MENYLIYPTKIMNLSQSYLDKYSHIDAYNGIPQSFPIDEKCEDTGRSNFYCPCDEIEIKRIYGVGNKGTNTIWLQSTSKVQTPTFEDYITIMVIHPNDDTLEGLKVGQKFKRFEKLFLEGKDGNATGNHFHIEICKGIFKSCKSNGWVKNSKGVWVLSGDNKKPEECFYIDEKFTTIKDSKGLKFQTLPKTIGTPVERNKEVDQIEVLIGNLRARDKADGNVLGYIKKGLYDVLNTTKSNKYNWYEVESNKWVAYSDEWAIFYKKEDKPINSEINPIEPQTPKDDVIDQCEQKANTDTIELKKSAMYDLINQLLKMIIDFLSKFKGGK